MGIVEKLKKPFTLVLRVINAKLYEKLVSSQSENLALQEEKRALRDTVRQQKEKLDLRANVVWEKPFYWLKDGAGKSERVCPKCWDSDEKPIRLQDKGNDVWECLNCKNLYYGPNYVRPTNRQGPWQNHPFDFLKK